MKPIFKSGQVVMVRRLLGKPFPVKLQRYCPKTDQWVSTEGVWFGTHAIRHLTICEMIGRKKT